MSTLPARIRLTGQELTRLGGSGTIAAGPLAALSVLSRPEVMVGLDVSVRRAAAPEGTVRATSWQCCLDGLVATLSTAGGDVFELGWLPAELWRFELARAATVTADLAGCPALPPVTELPYELVLAVGGCLRAGRDDVFGELLGRYAARVRAGVGDRRLELPDDPAAVVRAVALGATGRLRATVLPTTPGQTRIGVAQWLGFDDGWRRLEPVVRDGLPMVRLRTVQAADLGADVAGLVARVRR